MGNPSGEKPNTDYSDEVIAARAELAFKVRLDWIRLVHLDVEVRSEELLSQLSDLP